jgi:aspartyl/asparaginyl-tRNA synthetase
MFTHKKHLKTQYMIGRLREFFLRQGFVEVYPQPYLSILAACEDPATLMRLTTSSNVNWPLPQTNQMHLETWLLTHPQPSGCFCVTTSYRDEPHPIPGRHDLVFPMFEFEAPGSLADLRALEEQLMQFLGFTLPAYVQYEEACQQLKVDLIGAAEEQQLCEHHGPVIFLEHFPMRSQPYWNMRHGSNDLALKIDVLLNGMETIGSAEREVDGNAMWQRFHEQTDGQYAHALYTFFGQDRVERELTAYLALPMFPRFGGGIGVSRLVTVMEQLRLLE